MLSDPSPKPWPDLFATFRTTGKLEFQLTEELFDQDFPSHYCRKIKSVDITIPAIVGPYQNVHATLRQTTNRLLFKPDAGGRKFLLSANGDKESLATILRSDWRPQQQIAISRGVNDSGLFELNFRDERYLPAWKRSLLADPDPRIHLPDMSHPRGMRYGIERPRLPYFYGIIVWHEEDVAH